MMHHTHTYGLCGAKRHSCAEQHDRSATVGLAPQSHGLSFSQRSRDFKVCRISWGAPGTVRLMVVNGFSSGISSGYEWLGLYG